MFTEQIKTTDANKALVHRLINEWWGTNTPDPSVADELIGPDFIDHGMPGQVPGPEGVKQGAAKNAAEHATAWGDLRYTLDELIAEGDKVVARGSWSGTHKGDVKTPFGTMPGTGKKATVQAIAIFRIADGKLAEQRGMFDDLSFYQQVGAIPTPDEVSV
jgi:predicted ester cyclase